jgi:pimeloyl-ACP methyl ester carboxylesterase
MAVRTLEPELGPASVPLWREVLFGFDWLALRLSPVYYGIGVKRGDGEPVVIVPGFLGTDTYLMEMYYWLRRIGYTPYYSRIGRNADCPDILTERLFETIYHAHEETGRKVHLVGHSLGGLLSRSAAVQRPDLVAQVISLASPFRDIKVHPMILAAAGFVRGQIRERSLNGERVDGPGTVRGDCYTGSCTCAFVQSLRQEFPESVARSAIYTETDGVVDWKSCIEEDRRLNKRVDGTHVGLTFNPQVYRHIATLLAGGHDGGGRSMRSRKRRRT